MIHWNNLSIRDKALYIKLGVSNGIRDLNTIRDTYNNVYAGGGKKDAYHKDLKKIADSSNTNFILRLNDPHREYIYAWEKFNPDYDDQWVATHKMGYNGNAVFPIVLQVGSGLLDFSNPTVSPTENVMWENAYNNAVKNGDIIYFPTEKDAEYFSKNYKTIYNEPFGELPTNELNYAYGGNLFKHGGKKNPIGFDEWKKAYIKHVTPKEFERGYDWIAEDKSYDTEGFFNKYPLTAWKMVFDNPNAHFTDEFKTVYHPTNSIGSIYSEKVDSRFNPYGLKFGTWNGDHEYRLPKDFNNPIRPTTPLDTFEYLGGTGDLGAQMSSNDGKYILVDGEVLGPTLPELVFQLKAYGGHLNNLENQLSLYDNNLVGGYGGSLIMSPEVK